MTETKKWQFKLRGLIEGFYGTPWTWEQRSDFVPRLKQMGFNAYLYAPKDDDYVREHWRELYDKKTLSFLNDFKNTCEQTGIQLIYLLAPAFSMVFSSSSDHAALIAKYSQLYDIGIRTFGLLFDDVSEVLKNDADRKKFGSVLNAHIYAALRTYNSLKKIDEQIELIVCPMEYSGDGSKGYLGPFAKAIPDDVKIFYTGDTACAYELTVENAKRFSKLTGKKPLYWDNYPVNDNNMSRELHIAPIINRDKDLALHSDGLVVNPMELMEASMLPLYTFGEYLNDGNSYNPEDSFKRAVNSLLGETYYDAVSVLRELCYKSPLTFHGEEFPQKDPRIVRHTQFLSLIENGTNEQLKTWASAKLERLKQLQQCENKDFLADCNQWIKSGIAFLEAVTHLDKRMLKKYLEDDPEDVMLYESRKLLERLTAD